MKHLRIIAACVAASVSLSACATAGGYDERANVQNQINTNYANIPDLDHQYMINGQPVDSARLEQDKAECAGNVNIDPTRSAVNGALAGALLGAALGAALGGRNAGYWAGREAVRGAAIGGVSSGVNAGMTLHAALGRCMAGRGYNVLD